jgi:hypothetical protein
MNKPRKEVRYQDDDYEMRDGEVIERNGNLTLVRDRETGEESYRSPFEVEDY